MYFTVQAINNDTVFLILLCTT